MRLGSKAADTITIEGDTVIGMDDVVEMTPLADADGAAWALAPDLIVTHAGTHADRCLLVGKDGRSRGLVPRARAEALGLPIERLPHRALLPGFVNAHSHVFQRLLRGRIGYGSAGADHDSFWTWRDRMYAEAATLTPDSLYAVATDCYHEMLGAGYTAVGEFHYVHHAPDGAPYDDPLAMSRAVMAAASESGIRLALLPAAYQRAGFDGRSHPLQRRFYFPNADGYLRLVDDLRSALRDPRQTVGVAPHSVRAVSEEWLAPIARYAREQGLVLHVHASEQVAEVEDARRQRGRTPIGILAGQGVLGRRTTLVHATHATEEDCRLIEESGTRVCVCPTTEGDLGDGIAPYASFVAHGIPLAIGSDSQARIDPLEELRWAEWSARMRYGRRRVLTTGPKSPGALLLEAGTRGGAVSLGLDAGTLDPGQWADLVAVDLDHPSLRGAALDDLRDTLIFGAGREVVTDTWVGGRRIARI